MINLKTPLLFLVLFMGQNLLGQTEINNYGDTIQFHITNQLEYAIHGQLDKDKKTLFFIEGSLPCPSYYKYKDTVYYIGPQEVLNLTQHFNLILLGKPKIPLVLDYRLLNKDFIYRDSTGVIPENFLLNDHADFYISNYTPIIDSLKYKYELRDIYIYGHSQGARIASQLALHNTQISGIILSSVDPLGRVATVIDKNFADSEKGDKIKYLQSIIKEGSNSTDSTFMNSTYYSWQSFSFPLIITLSQLNMPVLIMNGSRDINCPNCYVYGYLNTYMPNVKTITFENLDHNFIDDKDVMHWDATIKTITTWLLE